MISDKSVIGRTHILPKQSVWHCALKVTYNNSGRGLCDLTEQSWHPVEPTWAWFFYFFLDLNHKYPIRVRLISTYTVLDRSYDHFEA